MSATYHLARFGATATGFGLLAASTYAITHGDPFALESLTASALAAGVGIAAALAPRLRAGILGGFLVTAVLIAGEAHNVIRVAETQIAVRDAKADDIRADNASRSEAVAALADAQKRFDRAEQAVTAADTAIAASASERGCKSECAKLLTAQKAAALAERDAARQARDGKRQELQTIPPPKSEAPLADRLGVDAWAIDLLAGGLLAACVNGLAALLIYLGNRPAPIEPERIPAPVPRIIVDPAPSFRPDHETKAEPDTFKQVASFCEAYRARHGHPPSYSIVRTELGLSAATASRLRRRAIGSA